MKRILAFVLTLCLVFSLFPANVVVAAGTELKSTPPAAHPNAAYGKGGHGDASVTWTAINTTADLDKLATSGHYYLAADVGATKMQKLDGVTVTLCLGGKTLSAGNISRQFELVNGASLTICDCTASGTGDEYVAGTVKPGKNAGGIARLDAKRATTEKTVTLTILDGIFDGADANGNSTATGDYCGLIRLYRSAAGAAASASKLDIQGGKFANRRGGRGGAIVLSPNTGAAATISNAYFVNCDAWQDQGGVIDAETGSLTIDNCVFKNNKAKNDKQVNTAATLGKANGGVIYAKSCSLVVKNSRFEGNTAANFGGVIYAESCSKLEIQNSQFKGNTAVQGGALYVKSCSNVSIQGSRFEENAADYGGALFSMTGVCTIKDSVFTKNQSTGSGPSVLHMETSSKITLDGCTVTDNVKTANPPTEGKTGAIDLLAESSTLTLKGKTVIDNNTEKDGTECNLRMAFAYNANERAHTTITVDGLTAGSNVNIYTAKDTREDPNNLLVKGANQTDWNDAWVQYDNKGKNVGISNNTFIYVDTPVNNTHEAHYNCACILANSGMTGCAHTDADKVEYQPWESDNTLPVSGNYYLTKDVKLTAATTYTVEANTTLNLCLNGHTIDFRVGTGDTSGKYSVTADGTLNIINCKAKLNDKGQLECGDKNRPTEETAGRITGGMSQYGSAIYAAGTVNACGVNFYGNGKDTGTKSCGVIYLNNDKSTVTVMHSRFESNKGAFGAVGTYTGGALTLHDTVLTKNSGASGGAIYYRSRTTVKDPTLVISGDSQFTENTATGSGGAIYVTVGQNSDDATTLSSWKPVQVTVQDEVQIASNTSGASSKGALAMDAANGSGNSVLTISGNVKIAGNNGATGKPDVFLASKARVAVGTITDKTDVNVTTSALKTDPDDFLLKADAALAETTDVGVTYVNNGKVVGYNATENFYFYDPAVLPDHIHHNCACILENSGVTGCTHTDADKMEYQPWTDLTKLPTKGNWYLTGNVSDTGAQVKLASGDVLNLCLNGYSIQFNPNQAANTVPYYVDIGATLNIINCQAKLDADGMYVCGDKNNEQNTTAGKLTGGRGTYGGALYTKGDLTLIGVELSENQANHTSEGIGGAIRVQQGGVVTILHSKLANNTAKSSGGAISSGKKPVSTIVLKNTIISGNTSATNGGAINLDIGTTLAISDCLITGNKAGSCGGAITTRSGENTITIHNTDITNNSGAYSGGLYLRSMSTAVPVTATITGECDITGNKSTAGSGGAIYVCVSDALTNKDANNFKPVNLTLDGDITITGNSSSGANGAVAYDVACGAETSYLTLAGNVVIKDNTTTKTRENVTTGSKAMIKVGQLGANAEVYITNSTMPGDPDTIMVAKDANLQEATNIGISYKNGTDIKPIGYSADPAVKFYFYDPAAVPDHFHHACACELEGGSCDGHGTEAELGWVAWPKTDSLPTTEGNWYLTGDVVLTNTNPIAVTGGVEVNLCLNGYSVKFNENNTLQANYYVYAGNELTIMNCQAKVDEKGLYVCGNKNDPTNEQAGRLFNGRGIYGGAVYVKGDLNLIGVEFYDNQTNTLTEGIGGAIRVQDGGKLYAAHCLFDNNKAPQGGGAIGTVRGDTEVTLHDTVLTNNEAVGMYVKKDGSKTYYSATKQDGYAIDEGKGRGGALYVSLGEGTAAAQKVTKDVVVNITGDTKFEGNYTNADIGNGGGAIGINAVKSEAGKHLLVTIGDDVQILNNTSRSVGAALYINNNSPKGAVKVTIQDNVKIDGNEATKANAGAIYINNNSNATESPELTITDNVQISNNKAAGTGGGGAIYVAQNNDKAPAKLTISGKVQFVGNQATKGNGGAIHIQNTRKTVTIPVTITGEVLFKNNAAGNGKYGGAIYVQGTKLDVTGATFEGNTATYGAAIANGAGNAEINLHNITAKGNIAQNAAKTAGNGGFAYIKTYAGTTTTKDVTLTVSGDSVISGNSSYSSGTAIYVSRDFTNEKEPAKGAPEGITCRIILKDNTTITGNTALRTSGTAKGAVGMDNSSVDEGTFLEISGNVVIANNVNKLNGQIANVYLSADNKLMVGELGTKANVHVYTVDNYNDPDDFTVLAEGVKLADSEKIGVVYENVQPAMNVGYNNKKKIQFYFAGEYAAHEDHVVCACVLTDDASCKHSDTVEWTAWIYNDKLPTTTGNYYLTGDIVVTSNAGGSIGVFEVKNGQKVNLCLNGYSIKFSDKNTTKANYYAMQGSELSIINCKAELDKNNHLVSAEGGKITGGRGLYGGALYTKGKLNLIGIELCDNMVYSTTSQNAMANSYGGAVRIQSGGILRATSCLFQNNKALYHGGAIAVGQGDAEVYLHDTVLKNNEAIGVYTKTEKVDGKTVTTVSPTKDDENFKLDEAKGRGGAIYFNVNHLTSAGNGITKAPVLELSGNTLLQGNITNAESGGQGGAIAISNPSNNGFNLKVTIKDNVQILDNCSRATGGAIYINHGSNAGAPEITIQDNVKISGNKSLAGNGGAIYANLTNKHKVSMKLVITDNVQITGNSSNYSGGAIFMQHTTTGEAAEITLSGKAKLNENKAGNTGAAMQLNGNFVLNITDNAEVCDNKASTYAGGIYGIKNAKGDIGPTFNITGGKIAKNEAMGKLDTKTGKMKEGYGGGIYIKQGVINMTGGEISENKANYGGGVFFNSTKFTFTAGKITKNFGKANGGGVSSSQFSEFIMNGKNAIVSYNTSDGPAAGVLIQGRKTSTLDGKSITKDYGTTMTMTNGQIYGNTAQKQGGGIYVSTESRAIIKGGSITGNESIETGGGMYESKGEILVYGGYFANNKVGHAGGALHGSEGKLHVYGGTFENNEGKYGAAIRTYNFTDTHIEGATFIDNHVINCGGAIALQSDTLVKNCTFKGNSALKAEGATNECDGGALWVWGGDTYNRPSYEVTIEDCLFEENETEVLGGAAAVGHNCTLTVKNTVFKNNSSRDRGGALATVNGKTQRQKLVHLFVEDCEFVGNEAVNDGGAIYNTWVAEAYVNNSTFTDNKAGRDGGAFYGRKQSDTYIDGSTFTGNAAGLRGAAIFAGDNTELSNITVTGNKSGDTYAVYIDEGGYDGDSYIRALIKFYGDIIIKDNEGTKQDLFIAKKALVNIGYQGLGEKTEFNVELAEGVLTSTILGAYNYEGGNLKYTVTAGDRSLTDPEPIPVVEPEVEGTTPATEPAATEPGAQSAGLGIGGIAAISAVLVVAVIAVIAAVAVKKKKKAENNAEETVQE